MSLLADIEERFGETESRINAVVQHLERLAPLEQSLDDAGRGLGEASSNIGNLAVSTRMAIESLNGTLDALRQAVEALRRADPARNQRDDHENRNASGRDRRSDHEVRIRQQGAQGSTPFRSGEFRKATLEGGESEYTKHDYLGDGDQHQGNAQGDRECRSSPCRPAAGVDQRSQTSCLLYPGPCTPSRRPSNLLVHFSLMSFRRRTISVTIAVGCTRRSALP